MFEIGSECYIVECSSIVKKAKILGRQYNFYMVQLDGSSGAIYLKKNRLFETEEAAKNNILGKRIIDEDEANNDDIGFIDVFEGKRFKKNPYI